MVRLRQAAILTLSLFLVLCASAIPARAEPADSQAGDGVIAWLAAQRTDHLLPEERADLALALLIGGAPVQRVDPLLNEIEFMIEQDQTTSPRVLAKAAVVLDIAQRPLVLTGLSGAKTDIIGRLRASVGRGSVSKNQYDAHQGQELSTQAWGIVAELRVGGDPTEEVGFLIDQQCDDGTIALTNSGHTCGSDANIHEHALVLSALVAAAESGLDTRGADRALADWFVQQRQSGQVSASVAAYNVWPLNALGMTAEAASAQQQVAALQLSTTDTTTTALVGAIGGETQQIKSAVIAGDQVPSISTNAAAILGLTPSNLSTASITDHDRIDTLTKGQPTVIGPIAADPGETATFLIQDFPPQETVQVRYPDGAVAVSGQTDSRGTATLSLSVQAGAGDVLNFTSQGHDLASANLSVSMVASSPEPDAAGVEPQQKPSLTTSERLGLGGLGVVLLAGALLLRRPRSGTARKARRIDTTAAPQTDVESRG